MGSRVMGDKLEMIIELNVDPTTVPGEVLNQWVETSPEIGDSIINTYGDDESGPPIRFDAAIPSQRENPNEVWLTFQQVLPEA